MTIVFATKHNNQIWISADTYLTSNPDAKIDTSLETKLLLLDNAVLGFAGDVSMQNIMEYFLAKNPQAATFDSKIDVIGLFLEFKKFLRRNAEYGRPASNQHMDMNSYWLLATKNKMYEINFDGCVIEHDDFCAIGSGGVVAKAIFNYMTNFQPKLSIKTMIERTHLMTCNQVASCGGDQEIINVTLFLDEKNKK
jgi:ATP-dependent protease HslVU (ClpYQ) peptidase subunit